jgi:hypothetical protein
MTRLSRWFATTSLFLFSSLGLANGTQGQTSATPDTMCELCFGASPETQLFAQGEAIVLVLSIYNRSAEPIFVSSLKSDEFVDFNVIGPDGKEVQWRGTGRIDSRAYSQYDFAVLGKYHVLSAKRVISFKDGRGFIFDRPGQYTVTAEYSLGPPEYFAPFAGKTKVPIGSFTSGKAAFCIEACTLEPLPVHRNTSQSALKAVRVFYTRITKHRPLGIPRGDAKSALWPLLSRRLAQKLDGLQACEDDYYRRYGEILKANQYKPATPWLEEGLFSGPIEASAPTKFMILSSRAIGENRVDVHLRFNGAPGSQLRFDGVVSATLENKRWVIDDFVAMYGNDELIRLSDGYSECAGGKWVGGTP